MAGIDNWRYVPSLPPSLDDEGEDENPAGLVYLPASFGATAPTNETDPDVVVVVLAAKRGTKARTLPRSRSIMMVPKKEERGKSPCFLFSRCGVGSISATCILDMAFSCRFNGLMM